MDSTNTVANSQKAHSAQGEEQEIQNQDTKIMAKLESRAENLLVEGTEQFKSKGLPKVKNVAKRVLAYAQSNVFPQVKTTSQHGLSYAKDKVFPKVVNMAHKGIDYAQSNVLPKVKEKIQPAIDYMQNVVLPNAKTKIYSAFKNIDISALKSYDKASILATLTIASKLCSLPIIRLIPIVNFIPAITTIFTVYTAISPIMEIRKNKIVSHIQTEQLTQSNSSQELD